MTDKERLEEIKDRVDKSSDVWGIYKMPPIFMYQAYGSGAPNDESEAHNSYLKLGHAARADIPYLLDLVSRQQTTIELSQAVNRVDLKAKLKSTGEMAAASADIVIDQTDRIVELEAQIAVLRGDRNGK